MITDIVDAEPTVSDWDSGDHHEHSVPEIWLAMGLTQFSIGVVKERQRF